MNFGRVKSTFLALRGQQAVTRLSRSWVVSADHLRDPEYRAEHERTQLARAVALAVTQQFGMRQPAIARLESGDVTRSVDTLLRLSHALGMEFRVDITPPESR
jgi:transcriptional regulator with XRE-family HTH domain